MLKANVLLRYFILISVWWISACTSSDAERGELDSASIVLPKPQVFSLTRPSSPCDQLQGELKKGRIISKTDAEYKSLMDAWKDVSEGNTDARQSIEFLQLNVGSNTDAQPTVRYRVYTNQTPVWPHVGIWHKPSQKWFQSSDLWMEKVLENSLDNFSLSHKQAVAIAKSSSAIPSADYKLLDNCRAVGAVDQSGTLSRLWLVSFFKGAEGLTVVVDDTTQKNLKASSLTQY